MTFEQEKKHRERVADARRKTSENERHAKKMLGILKKALSSGGAKTGGSKASSGTFQGATRGANSWKKEGRTPPLLLKIHAGGANGDCYSERQTGAQFIASNMLGPTAQKRKLEFALDVARRPTVNPKNLFIHCSLSRPANEALKAEEWIAIVSDWLKNIDALDCQYVATRHVNTGNDHCHIVFSRVKPNGDLVSMSQNRWSWRAALRQTELRLGITTAHMPQVANSHTPTSDRMVNAQRRAARLKKPDCFIDPNVIELVLSKATTQMQFINGIRAAGIDVNHAVKNGKVTGVLFKKNGAEEWLAGSSIGREFSLPRLKSRIESNRVSLCNEESQAHVTKRWLDEQLDLERSKSQLNPRNFERDL